jgi:hypothetical protein
MFKLVTSYNVRCGSHGKTVGDSSLLGCDTVSFDKQFQTFLQATLPSPSESSSLGGGADCFPLRRRQCDLPDTGTNAHDAMTSHSR